MVMLMVKKIVNRFIALGIVALFLLSTLQAIDINVVGDSEPNGIC